MKGGRNFSASVSSEDLPWHGFPCFYACLKGSESVVMINVAAVVAAGSSMKQLHNMLGGLSPRETRKWMAANSCFLSMAPGTVAFVPFGWLPWTLTTPDADCFLLVAPFLSAAAKAGMTDKVKKNLQDYFDAFLLEVEGSTQWRDTGPTIQAWLKQ